MTDPMTPTRPSEPATKLRDLGGSHYEVEVDGRVLGQVRLSPRSTASKPRWTAYRLNPGDYLGPLGIDGWDRPTRREAIEQLLAATLQSKKGRGS